MSELHVKQVTFARLLPRLIDKAFELGFEVSVGEVLRTKAQAEANAASGAGISNSVHLLSLAVDLNLFKDDAYITDSTGHDQLGLFWKSLGPDNRWGGDFARRDFNHYSITYQGVA